MIRALPLFAAGCTYFVTLPADDTDTGGPPVDTSGGGSPPGDLGNLHLARDQAAGTTTVYGLFVASAPNYLDLARCVIEEGPCLPRTLGNEGPPVRVPTGPTLDRAALDTRFLGDEVRLGPFVLPYREDAETGLGFYATVSTAEVTGWVGASWTGQWPAYEGSADLFVPAHLVLSTQSLGPLTDLPVPVEWIPAGADSVTVSVQAEGSDLLVYTVDDDGFFEVDPFEVATELGLTEAVEPLTITVTRWSRATDIQHGNVIEYVSSSEDRLTAELLQVGTRTRADGSDECAAAQGAVALAPGAYLGRLGAPTSDADYDAPPGCLGHGGGAPDSAGPDAVYRVEVPPGTRYIADYALLTASGAVYFVADCDDVLGTCIDGADLDPAPGAHELAVIDNLGDEPVTAYLVVDSTVPGVSSWFTLDLTAL